MCIYIYTQWNNTQPKKNEILPFATTRMNLETMCSVNKSCPTLYDPMDCNVPGFPVLHYFPEFAQIHVH